MARALFACALLIGFFALGSVHAATLGTTGYIISRGADAVGDQQFVSIIGAPTLNDAGQVAFRATQQPFSGLGYPLALVRSDGEHHTTIARIGTPLAGEPANILSLAMDSLATPIAMNQSGQIAFAALLRINNGARVFRSDGNAIVRIDDGLALGNELPGSVTIDDAGNVAFVVESAASGQRSVFLHRDGQLIRVVSGSSIPPDGYTSFRVRNDAVLSESGDLAFTFEGVRPFIGGSTGLAVLSDSELSLVTNTTPGMNPTLTVDSFLLHTPRINGNGQVALVGSLVYAGRDGSRIAGLLRLDDPANISNSTATALVSQTLSAFHEVALTAFNDHGVALLNGRYPRGPGLYIADGESIRQIAAEQQTAPGGGSFSAIGFGQTTREAALNNRGQVAFLATLSGTPGGAADDLGIFMHDPLHGLINVVREGDSLRGSTISALAFSANASAQYRGLNNNGQLAYHFTLADGRTGIGIWTIPEPSAVVLALGVCAAAIVSLRRRRTK